ncbi:dual serine/threonine and tyrosine protein kinase-like isoform X2 [Babylonia areolata]|uniref:dual serine/threonine and tyrosine protein kinase-like isoform X2 n=1 Tax=Babylonia areolata TaxID=304850 RepID=UPI003FCF59D3
MPVNLANELHKFCGHSHRLRQIFEETKRCFDDINYSGNFDGTQLITAELLKEEESEIVQIIEKPPAIVVFGQNAYTKSRIVNELFNKTVLHCHEDDASTEARQRMVCFKHGNTPSVSLTLPEEYDLVDTLEADNGPWKTVPRGDLAVSESDMGSGGDYARGIACLEVKQSHALLRYGTHVVVAPSGPEGMSEDTVQKSIGQSPAILVYGLASDQLYDKDIQDLGEIGMVTGFQPVFFVRVPPPGSRTIDTDPPDGCPESLQQQQTTPPSSHPPSRSTSTSTDTTTTEQDSATSSSTTPITTTTSDLSPSAADLHAQLGRLGYLPGAERDAQYRRAKLTRDYLHVENMFVERFNEFMPRFARFVRQTCQSYLVNAATVLNNSHTRCLKMFILSAFDMARDMLITPKKLEFAREKEDELYRSLLAIAVSKINDIKNIISDTIRDISEDVKEDAAGFELNTHGIQTTGRRLSSREVKECTAKIQEMVLSRLNSHVAGKLLSSVNILRDSYTGILTRCLESLEGQADSPEEAKTTDALKQILNAAYQVEITVRSSSSFIKSLLEKMKQLMMSMPWNSPPQVDGEWKKRVAMEMLSSLSEARLAKSIAGQIKDRLNRSHEAFAAALKQLETRHCGRLDRIEEQRLKLRKVHAPRLAKLALESTSLRDSVMYGMPPMGREIGRGQYGVVYSCDSWASYSPVAIKSVVPPDEKHWNDLALEFFYTKNIPEHKRIVALRGSVIDYMYGGGMSPAVLLVMDRLQKDLYTAIKQGLDWYHRLQVAIDVVDGLRFLHSQGLVHRDVKLKNVLLDKENHGKITDLGFCKPEAMISGSIVGTPIHMAPELFTGHYDNSVDVYAFGILFWYVCAGHVHLPSAFEQCANKDQLWQSVKKGLRPERLPTFTEPCWQLMQSCWEGEPSRRPYFGDVETVLKSNLDKVRRRSTEVTATAGSKVASGSRSGRSSRTSPSKHILNRQNNR